MNTLIQEYKRLCAAAETVPCDWHEPCTHTESTLHQLAPYIGKLKSRIARDLIKSYSHRGDLVVDPFCGSGTVVLEACLAGRRGYGGDVNPYAAIVTQAKVRAPVSLDAAILRAEALLHEAEKQSKRAQRAIPQWVKAFFHPGTLREVLAFADVCREQGEPFFLACMLGILHHQRPGFLSFPSSHLVPYLRSRNFPLAQYPSLYGYRPLKPRLLSKIQRVYKRHCSFSSEIRRLSRVRMGSLESIGLPRQFDCVITSPPYMNALDYGRDNRLRMWFVDHKYNPEFDTIYTASPEAFRTAIRVLAKSITSGLKKGGYCVLVVADTVMRRGRLKPGEVICDIFDAESFGLRLKRIQVDHVPDIRRSRRECRAVKREHILVFQKEQDRKHRLMAAKRQFTKDKLDSQETSICDGLPSGFIGSESTDWEKIIPDKASSDSCSLELALPVERPDRPILQS